MSDPVDLITAVQDAVFAALETVPAALGGGYLHVLENTQPPLNIIGAIDVDEAVGKADGLTHITFDVASIYKGSDRRALLAQVHAVHEALHDQPLVSDAATLHPAQRVSAAVGAVERDGLTYFALSTFELYAER